MKCALKLKEEAQRLNLLSAKSNESLDEVHTEALPFLAADHLLAMAHVSVADMDQRASHLRTARALLLQFLERCRSLGGGLLHPDERAMLSDLLEEGNEEEEGEGARGRGQREKRQRNIDLLRREKETLTRIQVPLHPPSLSHFLLFRYAEYTVY